MSKNNVLDRFLDYKTNYFLSIPEFRNKYEIINEKFFNIFHIIYNGIYSIVILEV